MAKSNTPKNDAAAREEEPPAATEERRRVIAEYIDALKAIVKAVRDKLHS